MTKGYVRAATAEDGVYLSTRLRPADLAECLAASGRHPKEYLAGTVVSATRAFTQISRDGEPMAVFGTHKVPGMSSVGAVWLLASPVVLQHSTQFLRESRGWVEVLHQDFPVLINLVDERNVTHIRWIEWCGFSLLARRERYGAAQLPFIEFAKVKK